MKHISDLEVACLVHAAVFAVVGAQDSAEAEAPEQPEQEIW